MSNSSQLTSPTLQDSSPVAGLRLSPSALELFHACPRLFYLGRVAGLSGQPEVEDRTFHLDYGKAMEAGIVNYLQTGQLEQAVLAAWLAYNDHEARNKTLESLVAGLEVFARQWPYAEWQLQQSQIGFKLEFDPESTALGIYYCGYIDASLLNQFTGRVATLECKTTGYAIQQVEALYQNTEQAIAYPTIMDYLGRELGHPASDCLYVIVNVARSWIPTIEFKTFAKSKAERLEWLLSLKIDVEDLKRNYKNQFWPMRGKNCIQYNRPCQMFGICHLNSLQQEQPAQGKVRKDDFEHVIQFEKLYNWLSQS